MILAYILILNDELPMYVELLSNIISQSTPTGTSYSDVLKLKNVLL